MSISDELVRRSGRSFSVVVLLAAILVTAPHGIVWSQAKSGPNLVANGSFELDENGDGRPDGWRFDQHGDGGGSSLALSRDAYQGHRSIRISCPTTRRSVCCVSKGIPLAPKTRYALMAYIKRRLEKQRGYDGFVAVEVEGVRTWSVDKWGAKSGQDWQTYSRVFSTGVEPADSTVRCVVYLLAGDVWFDDVSLVPLGPVQPIPPKLAPKPGNLIANGNMEVDDDCDGRPDDWHDDNRARASDSTWGLSADCHRGRYSLCLHQPTGNSLAAMSQSFPTKGGATYKLSAWVKADQDTTILLDTRVSPRTWRRRPVRRTWTQITYVFPTYPDGESGTCNFYFLCRGRLYLDDVTLTESEKSWSEIIGQTDLSHLNLTQEHPCLFHNRQELDHLAERMKTVPWVREAVLTYRSYGRRFLDNPDAIENAKSLRKVVDNARAAAFAYGVMSDERDARVARDLLLEAKERWEVGDRTWYNYGGQLGVAAHAFDLIHPSPSISDQDRSAVGAFLRSCFEKQSYDADRMEVQNRGALNLGGLAAVAFCLQDRHMVEQVINGAYGFNCHMAQGCRPDGLWHEGVGYMFYGFGDSLWGLTSGYLGLVEAAHHAGLDLYREERFRKLLDTVIEYAYPNLAVPCHGHCYYGTTLTNVGAHYERLWARSGEKKHLWLINQAARAEPKNNKNTRGSGYWNILNILEPNLQSADYSPQFRSRNFTDMGHAVLRSCPGPEQIYVLLDYGPLHSHAHPDKLNIVLYGRGRELSPDGKHGAYTERSFLECTNLSMGHNTVIVDEQNQKPSYRRECSFFEATPRVKVVDALGSDSYDGVTLQRTLALTDAYVVDFFRVTSREAHCYDWIYRNVGVLRSPELTSPRREPLGAGPGYVAVTELTSGKRDEGWSVDWHVDDECRVRVRMLGADGTEVITGRTLAGPQENLQAVFVRRHARETIYASVIEPYQTRPVVAAIASGDRPGERPPAAALAVKRYPDPKQKRPERRDYFLMSYDGRPKRLGPVTLDGQMGIVLGAGNGRPDCMLLIQGTELVCGKWGLEADETATIYAESHGRSKWLIQNNADRAAPISITGDFGPASRVFRTDVDAHPAHAIASKRSRDGLSFTIEPRSKAIVTGALP